MNSALWKDNIRTIKDSLPRFLSIFAIVALGVAFFIGVRASGPTMVKTTRNYYEKYNLPDGHVLSTLGLTEDDIDLLEKQERLKWAPMQSFNSVISPSEETAKVFTFNGDEAVNFYEIISGRMVEAPNEIVLDNKYIETINQNLSEPISIGDRITLDYSNDSEGGIDLDQSEFDVVGFARTPMYIERVTRSSGSAVFAIVSDEAVSGDIYSEAYYWVEEAQDLPAYSEEYIAVIDQTTEQLETTFEDVPEIRFAELKTEIEDSIQTGKEEVDDGYLSLADGQAALREAETELSKGLTSFDKGQAEFAAGKQAIDEGFETYKDGIKQYHDGRLELADGIAQLEFNEAVYEEGLAQYAAGLAEFNEEIAAAEAQLIDAQAQLDQNSALAQSGLSQLVAGQAAIDEGYAQLAAGRQELLEQIRLAADDRIDPEELLTQLEGQIDNINGFLALLEQNGDFTNDELSQWFAGLQLERDMLVNSSINLSEAVTALPNNTQTQTAAAEVLSETEMSQIEEILNIPLNSDTSSEHLITLMSEEVSRLEGLLPENSSASISETAPLDTGVEQEIAAVEEKNRELEAEHSQLLERLNQFNDSGSHQANSEALNNQLMLIKQQITEYTIALDEIQSLVNPSAETQDITEDNNAAGRFSQIQEQLQILLAEEQSVQQAINEFEQTEFNLEAVQSRLSEVDNELEINQAILEELLQNLLDSGVDLEEIEMPPAEEIAEILEQIRLLTDAISQLQAGQAELDEQSAVLDAAWSEYYAGLAQLESAQAAINQGWTELSSQSALGRQMLADSQAQLAEGRSALDEAYEALVEAQRELIEARRSLDEGYDELHTGQSELESGQIDLIRGRIELLHGQQLFQENQQTFADSAQEAMADLRQAELDLAEADSALEDLSEPTYMIENRTSSSSYQSVSDNAEQLSVISNIFPVFFFAIAILVTYTTIKRMASEQRNYMGTMKQLGYKDSTIIIKFVLYAGLAGSLGIIAGLLIGYLVFPPVVINAYNIMYYLEEPQIEILWDWNFITMLVALLTTLMPAIITPVRMLRTEPAQLLIPESPKAGKKLFLERLPALWNRISFYNKMTIRNLLRYKGRNFMTFLGVAGCTMLIVTGYGISDTISGIVDVQFGEIQQFDAMIYLNDKLEESEVSETHEVVYNNAGIESAMPVLTESYEVSLPDGQSQSISVVVPLGDISQFDEFITLRERGEEPSSLEEDGPFTTERLQELLSLKPGDIITLENEDFETFQVSDFTISENHVAHYLYVTPDEYREIFGQEPLINTYYINYNPEMPQTETENKLTDHDRILTVIDIQTLAQGVQDTMSSLDLITLVLIISAAALSFIVLYNLTNINVAERLRELSTFKVLGFYNYEVSMYISNEVFVLTILGGFAGLGLGTLLTHYLMKTMQMNDVLFYPYVSMLSYIKSFIISFIFSCVVMVAMHFKLKKIDMVEAMKAVD